MFAIKRKTLVTMLACIVALSVLLAIFLFTDRASAATEQQPAAQPSSLDNTTVLTGIGMGINVLTATRVNDIKMQYSILNRSSIDQLARSQLPVRTTEEKTYSTIHADELILNHRLDNSFKLSGELADLDVGLMQLGSELRTGSTIDFSSYNYKYYKLYEYCRRQYIESINEAWDPDTYAGLYSNEFKKALETVNNGGSIKDFFENYGTHLIGSAYFGGRLTSNFTMVNNTKAFSAAMTAEIDSYVNFPLISAGFESTVKGMLQGKYQTYDANYALCISALGGNAFSMNSSAEYSTSYNAWINSLNDDTNCVIIDYPTNGLVPVWEILPAEYSHLSSKLKSEFISLSQTISSEFFEEFKTGNYTEFSGGMGTSGDPFLITDAIQMAYITKYKTSHFALANDIDMLKYSMWSPIGSKAVPFTGTFDGRNHKISNFTRTGSVPEGDKLAYYGLFGYIKGATIANVEVVNPNISFDSSQDPVTGAKLFIGVVVGVAENSTLSNVTVNRGVCYYKNRREGMSFVGGIVGFTKNTTVTRCNSSAKVVSGRYSAGAGGIAGYSKNSIFQYCTSSGTVTSHGITAGKSCAGGIVGIVYSKSGEETYFYDNTVSATYSALNFDDKDHSSKKKGALYGDMISKDYES